MKGWTSSKEVWVLADLESENKYTPPVMHFIRYSGGDDFAMFSHVPTVDVLEAMHFGSYAQASKYMEENKNGMPTDEVWPRRVTITATIAHL